MQLLFLRPTPGPFSSLVQEPGEGSVCPNKAPRLTDQRHEYSQSRPEP